MANIKPGADFAECIAEHLGRVPKRDGSNLAKGGLFSPGAGCATMTSETINNIGPGCATMTSETGMTSE